MVSIREMQERALKGTPMKESEFDIKLSTRLRELVKEYDITLDPSKVVLEDDGLADDIFKAGVDLLVDIGLYCVDTKRNVKFTIEEVKEIIKTRPEKLTLGRGRDAITFKYRLPGEKRHPLTITGSGNLTEDHYIPVVQAYAQDPLSDGIMPGILSSVRGLENRAGTPGEIVCCIYEALWTREAVKRAGRPDMYIGLAAFGEVSAAAVIASFFPEGYTKYNSQIPVHLFSELRLTWNRLILAAYGLENGIIPWVSYDSILGLLCRGPEDAAVLQVAGVLGQLLYSYGSIANNTTINVEGNWATRPCLMATSASTLALSRNAKIPVGNHTPGGAAGPATPMNFYETVVGTLVSTASGAGWLWCIGGFPKPGINYGAFLESRLGCETARVIADIPRSDANDLINQLLKKYEEDESVDKAPDGKPLSEIYDITRFKPSEEYKELYTTIKKEMIDIGIPYE